MAAIERRELLRCSASLLLSPLCLRVAGAQQSDPLRSQLGVIANALTGGNPSEAMGPFSSSFRNYDQLRNYFIGLTDAFSISNEVDVADESATDTAITATVRWAITLSSTGSDNTNRRAADIQVQCIREKGKWRIVNFSPIDLFDPSQAQTPTAAPQSNSRNFS